MLIKKESRIYSYIDEYGDERLYSINEYLPEDEYLEELMFSDDEDEDRGNDAIDLTGKAILGAGALGAGAGYGAKVLGNTMKAKGIAGMVGSGKTIAKEGFNAYLDKNSIDTLSKKIGKRIKSGGSKKELVKDIFKLMKDSGSYNESLAKIGGGASEMVKSGKNYLAGRKLAKTGGKLAKIGAITAAAGAGVYGANKLYKENKRRPKRLD